MTDSRLKYQEFEVEEGWNVLKRRRVTLPLGVAIISPPSKLSKIADPDTGLENSTLELANQLERSHPRLWDDKIRCHAKPYPFRFPAYARGTSCKDDPDDTHDASYLFTT
jgi:hypothetical protein